MNYVVVAMWPIFFILTYVLFKKAKLSIFKYTYSNLGAHSEYGYIFNTMLVVVGLLQLFFLGRILITLISSYSLLGIIGLSSLILTTISGIFTGVITEKTNQNIHIRIAITGFVCSILGYILYGIYFLPTNITFATFMLFWGFIVMPSQVSTHFKDKKIFAINEFFMFLGAFITNIILVIFSS